MFSSLIAVERDNPGRSVPPFARSDSNESPIASQPPLIAVIDDNADIVEAVGDALSERGYRVVGFRDAAHALQELEQTETPSLIVLDLMMPQMDGWTFRIKQRTSPKLREIPVIVMSASGSAQAEAIHADVYLRKPLSMDRFCSAVEQTLINAERRLLIARSVEIERLRSLGLLASSVAHEINNPLTYISGNIDLALHNCQRALQASDPAALLPTIQKSLGDARTGADHVAKLISSLLVFARAEDRSAQTADPARSLQGAVQLSKSFVNARAMLKLNCPTMPRVVGHEARLGQVFLNLLMNAAQAIEPGAASKNRISVTSRVESQWLVVEIADSGRGIAPQNLDRVFEPFFTTKPVGEGTGIGLSFCKDTVEQAGGSISIGSTVDVGTTVTVRLKLAATPS